MRGSIKALRQPLLCGPKVSALKEHFRDYEEFFTFYLRQHHHPGNRVIHAVGTSVGVFGTIAALASGRPLLVLAAIVVAYAVNWLGHFLVEGNKPATFGHPWWSLVSDFRMLGLMMTGRLSATPEVHQERGRKMAAK